MYPIKCNCCGLVVYQYVDYGDYILCQHCETEMIAEDERRYQDEDDTYHTKLQYEGE